MKKLWLGIFVLAIIPVGIIWSGYVLSVLWGWLAVPLFGCAPLSVVEAVSLALIVGFLTHQYVKSENDNAADELLARTVFMFVRPAFALLIGWIVKSFM